MKKRLFFNIITISLLLFSDVILSQNLNLGTLSNFAAYSGTGAVSNIGTSTLIGDVGTNVGAVSGFGLPTTFNGVPQNVNALTVQAKIDLLRVYIHLSDLFVTNTTHSAAFGSGETITAGVYSIAGAGSLAGTVILNGQGNPNAVFVIKFEGAFTAGAASKVVLSNETRACNVFWIAEGGITIGAASVTKGTLIAHPGAIMVGANCNLEGRMLSSEGAITFGPGIASLPVGPITIPINCENNCDNNILGSVANFSLFTSVGAVANAATSGIIGDIGSNAGDISGFFSSTVAGSFYTANAITAQAKIDLDAAYLQLHNTPNTNTTHTPAFGSGETLNAGVYSIAAAGSLSGSITLDGQGNPNALFIFKFSGAFTTAAQSKVILANGTRRCNVFWIAEGAISMGTFTFMKGTLIANNGANTMGANGNLDGRMLSTTGAIGFSTGVIYNNKLCFSQPLAVIFANDDIGIAVNGINGGRSLNNILVNDTLNGTSVNVNQINLTTVIPNINLTLNADGSVDVVPNTPAGTYTLTYQICERINPTNCDQAQVTVIVSAALIDAIEDTGDSVKGISGGTNEVNILTNDTLNGKPVNIDQINLTTVIPNAYLTLNANFSVYVAPNTPAGTYTMTYQICEKLNPTNCDQAVITVIVTAASIATLGDIADSINGTIGGIDVINVLTNDTLDDAPVTIAKVNLLTITFNTYLTLNANGSVTVVPNTPAGTYNLTYQICEKLNPMNCDYNNVTIKVVSGQLKKPIVSIIQPTVTSATGTIIVSTPKGTGLKYSINNITYQSDGRFSGLIPGSYNLTVKNNRGCVSSVTLAIIDDLPIVAKATENQKSDFVVLVAPNPSSNSFGLQIKTVSSEKLFIKIIDTNGRTINQLTSNPYDNIELGSELNSGLYFIEVSQDDYKTVIKAQKL